MIRIITTKRLRSLEADKKMLEGKVEYFNNSLNETRREIVEDRKGYALEAVRHEKELREKNQKINEQSIELDRLNRIIEEQAAEIAKLDKELERLTDRDEKGRFVKREVTH